MRKIDHTFCIAPMMECSDRHDRYLLRLFSRNIMLYTEMVPALALVNGATTEFLRHDQLEHPVALQLGGSDSSVMAVCADLGEKAGFDEININVGCPSDRVQAGRFGVALMKEPYTVANCFRAMQDKVSIPVTIKCRIGVDDHDTYDHLRKFVEILACAGCNIFIVHARKAWLNGLSPKQNREIPPLQYDVVYRLKKQFENLQIIINGGIQGMESAKNHLGRVDGVMVGRQAYQNPAMLAEVDQLFFGSSEPKITPLEVLERYKVYIERQLQNGVRLHHITKHMLGLFQGVPGARSWRRHLSSFATAPGADIRVIEEAQSWLSLPQCYYQDTRSSGSDVVANKSSKGAMLS